MNLESLILMSLLAFAGYAGWVHANISRAARQEARRLTEKYGLLLLDQSVFLKKFELRRSKSSLFDIVRHYGFEFTSTGNQRYRGVLVYRGQTLINSDMDAYQSTN